LLSPAKIKFLDLSLLKRLLKYLRANNGTALLAVIFMLPASILSIIHPLIIKKTIDQNIINNSMETFRQNIVLFLLILCSSLIFRTLYRYFIEYLGQKIVFRLRMDILQKIFRLPASYFDRTPDGKTLTNITNDVESVRKFMSDGILAVAGESIKLIVIITLMLQINSSAALISFAILPVFAGITLLFRNSIRSGFRSVRAANSDINRTMVESLAGRRENAVFENRRQAAQKFAGFSNSYRNAFLKVILSYSFYLPMIDIINIISSIILLGYAHYYINIDISIGTLFAFSNFMGMFFRPLRRISERFNTFQSAMAGSERIFSLLDEKEETYTYARQETALNFNDLPPDIIFKNVSFSYNKGSSQKIINDLSLHIKAGEKVAIVGPTGAGKTTIIKLLNRLYETDSGSILINGKDIRSINKTRLRSFISTIPQKVFLFNGTVKDNISLFKKEITTEKVKKCALRVKAGAFIDALPGNYDENLLEEGKAISSGQKQLLSFARAIGEESDILILDEATANIDTFTEQLIESGMQPLLKSKTALIIAHRLSTIKNADRILVIHKGQLVESGTHAALIKQNGLYSRLYKMQQLATAID